MNYLMLGLFWSGVYAVLAKPKKLKPRLTSYANKLGKKLAHLAKPIKRRFTEESLDNASLNELNQVISYIKNVAILGNRENISVGTVLTQVAEFTESFSDTFTGMARYIYLNDKESARLFFVQNVNHVVASDFASILCNWDELSKEDLISMLDSCSNIIYEEIITRQKKRTEIISEIIYFPVTLNCMIVLLNFIYVSYFAEELEALELLF